MSPFRLLLRWVMTLLAIGLTVVAMLLLVLRLAAIQVDEVRPRLETLLSARFNADVSMLELGARWHGLDPALTVDELAVVSRARGEPLPLLEVKDARMRLNSSGSLRDGFPVIEDARIQGVTIHLYQTPERTWHWPDPAQLPPELQPDIEFDLDRLDFWVGVLLRQRVEVEDLRLVLHGQDRQVTLEAPSLLMTGDRQRAHLEGMLFVEGDQDVSLEAALEILPGRRGFSDFNAALQARMNIDSLVRLAEVLSRNDPVRLDRATGEAVLWGRWHEGELADARLDLDIPELTVSRDQAQLALEGIRARGQWLRGDDGWQAWLSMLGDEPLFDVVAEEPEAASSGPALPRHWQVAGDARGWRLKSSAFDLDALAAWRDHLPLPDKLLRLLDTLDPRGQVTGFSLEHRNGRWASRASLREAEVSPWQNAPGGGPVDAWVETEGLDGSVRFVGVGDTWLHFPKLFSGPMELASARGEVSWAYDGERARVEGQALEADWRGARVQGSFDLETGGGRPGELGLDLAFQDVDALDTPLVDWLPVGVLGDELNEWLAQGVAGRVPEGRLSLRQPLYEGVRAEDVSLDLDLRIEEGHLSFAPDWPALESVAGRLMLDDLDLKAQVEYAQSRGLWVREGRVSLIGEELEVSGEVGGATDDLLAYVTALPFVDLQAQDWESRGDLRGTLALSMPLATPDALALDLDTEVDAPYLRFIPMDLTMHDVNGELGYRHRDGQGGLTGELGARLFDGPVLARFDTQERQVSFEGSALDSGVLEWANLGGLDALLTGHFPYSAHLSLDNDNRRFSLDSDLAGLAIDLPAPLGKTLQERTPLSIEADLSSGLVQATLAERMRLRWREWGQTGQGQAWLEQWPVSAAWPDGGGWEVSWRTPQLDLKRWASALSGIGVGEFNVAGQAPPQNLRALRLGTECLYVRQRCVGSLFASAYPQGSVRRDWRLDLAGSLLEGHADYRPDSVSQGQGFVAAVGSGPIDVALTRLDLDALLPAPGETANLLNEVDVAPTPEVLPEWLADLPAGRLRVATLERRGQHFGPLTAYWLASPEQLVVAPLGLTLGEVSARGELVWEAAGAGSSLTRARLSLDGRDLGTALERLAQPVSIRNTFTAVDSQLAWPGAPWQFALQRSRGSLDIELRDGRFRYIDSPSAKLVGLLNIDNLVRRLRLDFSDVTHRGTAFDSVKGGATLYGGILETQGPVEIQGPATSFTLNGQVDLVRRELDQHLAVTVPLSQNLPLAAVVAGAPVVGGALFIAHRLFGGVIDKATRIHYSVRGPWTSPQIALEGAE
ncbi:TIGR02099 family protein [Litchfieldella qijiaojingensis]|uniref:TIGR02099 family protein n=1 Tax=Litchfieldella qijiaojingensis TaxID=980347 RepID=A0ABQ2YHT3_9GAMM|nr:AsmA-like C-terminal region-containing protein [Halomonas qijiaojingensis]GGX81972.1 TIGR02099 family protein [Halomonas qijiaojingensis]